MEAIVAKFREELHADTNAENADKPHNPEAKDQPLFLLST